MDAAPSSRAPYALLLCLTLVLTLANRPASAAEQRETHYPMSRIHAAAAYSAAHAGSAFVAIQHGKVIYEDYGPGGGRDTPHRIYSGTKGFWGLAAIAAIEDGLIDPDERVSATLPEWREDSRKSRITIRQLLQFTGGLERCIMLHEDGLSNRNTMAMGRPLQADPGHDFIYGPSQLQVFDEVLKRKLARHHDTPIHFLEHRVLRPMGLGSQRYLPDHSGNPLLAAGFMMSARDWARIGQVLLHDGRPVIKPESMSYVRKGSSANAAYSFGFWNNSNARHRGAPEPDVEKMLEGDWWKYSWHHVCFCREAPPDLLLAVGSHFQRLIVSPQHDLVVVRLGSHSTFQDGAFLRRLFGD